MASPSFMEASIRVLVFASMASASSPSFTALRSASAVSMAALSAGLTLSPNSATDFSVEWIRLSAWLRASTVALRFLSSAALASASRTMASMSESDRPPLAWMRIECSLLVALSLAWTLTMPLASMSKVTSTWGTPRGAGGMPTRSNWPSSLLSWAMGRSPWNTRMVTADWLSSAVEKVWLRLVGMVVLRSISGVNTPPRVSIPSVSGVTSSSSTSLTSPCSTPPCTAAPSATTSSGFTPLCGSRPKKAFTASTTLGMRVMPPTSTTSSIWALEKPLSFRACWQGPMVRSIRSSTRLSSLARVSFTFRCSGPEAFMEMKGRFTSYWATVDSSFLAFSASSFRRCRASLSLRRSTLVSFLNSSARKSTMRMSKSSPPRKVSPLVDFTSNTPSPISRIETSKVPPPRS